MMFTNFKETKYWIEHIKRFGSKLDLSRIKELLNYFNNPEKEFKTIHIAGTNGKGSLASYIKTVLVEKGFKVGLYTSPYVVKFNERITINDEFIKDEDVVKYANIIYPFWEKMYREGKTTTFFEVLTAMCFLYFKDQSVDFGVIEVGLGGKLDATNVIIPEISVITNISYDHMNVLGNTLESIAINKLGIVKDNVPLVTAFEQNELFPLFKRITDLHNSKMTRIDFEKISDTVIGKITSFNYKNNTYEIQLPGYHQIKNAVLAIETIKELNFNLNLGIDEEIIKSGIRKTVWPGRFEIFHKNIILDGAHNIGGIKALKETVLAMYPNKIIKCLVSIMHDKDHQKMIDILDSFCTELYFTQFDYERREDALQLFKESKHKHKKLYLDYTEIFDELTTLKENEILLITGSIYFISDVRKKLIK